jgi:hypothetical protein
MLAGFIQAVLFVIIGDQKRKGGHVMKLNPMTMLLVAVCLSIAAVSPWQSARLEQKTSPVSPEDVTLRIVDPETYQAELSSVQQGVDQYWAHGNSIHLEQPATGITLNHFGFGGEVTIIQSAPGNGAWVHFSIPTPRRVEGAFARLNRVIVAYNGTATIDRIDVWDGSLTRILTMPVNLTGNNIAFLDFAQPPGFSFGIGVSIHVVNRCAQEFCSTQRMLFPVAGADFSR